MDDLIKNLQSNKNVPDRCIATTKQSDPIFALLCDQYNIKYEKSPLEMDIYDHIDYILKYEDKTFTIDIKSAKKFFDNPNINLLNENVWIEFKNVNGGIGWVCGKADYIVWVFAKEMWFVRRKPLIQMILDNIKKNGNKKTENKYDSLYKWYTRQNRKDLITSASLKDIKTELNPKIFKNILTYDNTPVNICLEN